MAWCFSTRASVATVLTTHPCVSRCLRVKALTFANTFYVLKQILPFQEMHGWKEFHAEFTFFPVTLLLTRQIVHNCFKSQYHAYIMKVQNNVSVIIHYFQILKRYLRDEYKLCMYISKPRYNDWLHEVMHISCDIHWDSFDLYLYICCYVVM